MSYIDTWLVLGPLFNPAQQTPDHSPGDGHPLAADILKEIDSAANLDPARLSTPSATGPLAGDAVVYKTRIFPGIVSRWQPLRFQDTTWDNLADIQDNIHQKLAAAGFAYRHHALAFFLVYVTAPAELTTKLLVRSDDGIRVWLNGDEVKELAFIGERDMQEAETGAEVKLVKGENRLLCAVAETHVEWSFSARFSDDADLTFATFRGIDVSVPAGTVQQNLKELSDRYAIFEEDQVLTHLQLNSVTSWFEDQGRLSRLLLSGAGIVSGLHVSAVNGLVTVTRGFGLTTDGDLLHLPADTVFDRCRPYDRSRPEYSPFTGLRNSGGGYRIHELLAVGEKGHADSIALGDVQARTGAALADLTVVFFMENYVTDSDICSVTGCDNLGKQCRNRPTLLLIRKEDAATLGTTPNPAAVLAQLPPIDVPRVRLTKSISATADLVQAFRAAALTGYSGGASLHDRLVAVLSALPTACAPYFEEEPLPARLAEGWKTALETLRQHAGSLGAGVQYYYDFLKDLAETWNLLRELLLADDTWIMPPVETFPKHLLLGNLDGTARNRTAFRPSPLLTSPAETVRHARFLVDRISALIAGVRLPPETARISIAPCRRRTEGIEGAAIPCYYDAPTVVQHWSYRRRRRGTASRIPSINASRYGGSGTPFDFTSGYAPGFRIEGHLGSDITTALGEIRRLIGEYNLPLAVRPVLVGNDRRKVVRPPRYSDLDHIHAVLRNDLARQVDEVIGFTKTMTTQVTEAVKLKTVEEETSDGIPLETAARNRQGEVEAAGNRLRKKMEKGFGAVAYDETWKEDVKQTLTAVGGYKANFGHVIRTDFATPIDSLIGTTHLHLIDWIGQIIREREDRFSDRLRLPLFLTYHPGLEHCGEVPAGGTFILVHNESGVVLADFILPYHVPLEDDDVPPPVLRRPPIRPEPIRTGGIRVIPSIKTELGRFRDRDISTLLREKLELFRVNEVATAIDAKVGRIHTADIVQTVDDRMGSRISSEADRAVTEKMGAVTSRIEQVQKSLDIMGSLMGKGSVATPKPGGIQEYVDAMRQVEAVLEFAATVETPAERRQGVEVKATEVIVKGLEAAVFAEDTEATAFLMNVEKNGASLTGATSRQLVKEAVLALADNAAASPAVRAKARSVAVKM